MKTTESGTPLFPLPIDIARRNFWDERELDLYDAALKAQRDGTPAEEPGPDAEAPKRLLPANAVRQRYGGVSPMWLHRRVKETRAALAEQSE